MDRQLVKNRAGASKTTSSSEIQGRKKGVQLCFEDDLSHLATSKGEKDRQHG